MAESIDKGYPFTLICFNCGKSYEACYNDEPCKHCGDVGPKRWILNEGFEKEVPNPAECSIKNLKLNITGGFSL